MGCPLVGLVHVAMGSFLSLQAYFGSTFVDGTGAVVGVGLLRNLATLMTGMTLSGLLAGRMIPDLLDADAAPADDPGALPGSGGRVARTPGPFDDPPEAPDPGRLAAPRHRRRGAGGDPALALGGRGGHRRRLAVRPGR